MAQGGANGDTNEADSTTELQVDAASLVEENAGLRDQLLRALAEAENARRRAERAVRTRRVDPYRL